MNFDSSEGFSLSITTFSDRKCICIAFNASISEVCGFECDDDRAFEDEFLLCFRFDVDFLIESDCGLDDSDDVFDLSISVSNLRRVCIWALVVICDLDGFRFCCGNFGDRKLSEFVDDVSESLGNCDVDLDFDGTFNAGEFDDCFSLFGSNCEGSEDRDCFVDWNRSNNCGTHGKEHKTDGFFRLRISGACVCDCGGGNGINETSIDEISGISGCTKGGELFLVCFCVDSESEDLLMSVGI